MEVPVSQRSVLLDGKWITTVETIEVDEKVFIERMAELFHNATK